MELYFTEMVTTFLLDFGRLRSIWPSDSWQPCRGKGCPGVRRLREVLVFDLREMADARKDYSRLVGP